jgi:hypothetical protein
MKTINCLYMEDSDSNFTILSQALAMVLEKDVKLEFHRAHSPEEAMGILENNSRSYQFFIADLMFPDDPKKPKSALNPTGLIAVRKAHGYGHLAIAALSVAERTLAGTSRKFADETAGTGLYLDKDALLTRAYPRDELRGELLKLLASKGLLAELPDDLNRALPWTKGLRLEFDALIETLGQDHLVDLAKQAAPKCSRFEAHYVAPGYSGAVVLRVIGFHSEGHAIESNILLKCSRDRVKLQLELERSPESQEPASHVYVMPDSKQIYESGGWFATAWRFRQDAKTFISWLSDNTIDDELDEEPKISGLLDQLFTSGLNFDYRRGSENKAVSPATSLYPNVRGRFRIVESARQLVCLIKRVSGDSHFEIIAIENFLIDETISTRPLKKVGLGSYECWCHGDLHSRNILITAGHQPVLIDPARRIPTRHWASDVARLSSDLWISCWDQGPESFVWDKLELWVSQIKSWVENEPFTIQESNLRTYLALQWLRTNLDKVFEGCFPAAVPVWQFELAVAVEFLNLSSYETVPAPKRCLALLIAKDMLQTLGPKIPFVGIR